jgi:hypothetical protein
VTELLRAHQAAVQRLADALLLHETLDADAAREAAGLEGSAMAAPAG